MIKMRLLVVFLALIIATSCKESKHNAVISSMNSTKIKEIKTQSFEGLWVQVDTEGNFIDANTIKVTRNNDQFLVELSLENQKGRGLFSINEDGLLTGKIDLLGSISIDRIKHIDKKLNGAMSVIITDTPDVVELGLFKHKDSLSQ